MPKTRRYTKKKKFTKKRTKKYGYTYKKRKTYKRRKQKGGVKCLNLNNITIPPAVETPPEEETPLGGIPLPPPFPNHLNHSKRELVYKRPAGLDLHTIPRPFNSAGTRFNGTRPEKPLDGTTMPNLLIFWLDIIPSIEADRKILFKLMINELKGNDKKSHWIWWVYPNIKENISKKNIENREVHYELLTNEQYKLLKKSSHYQDMRNLIATEINKKINDSKINSYKDWFTDADYRRLKAYRGDFKA